MKTRAMIPLQAVRVVADVSVPYGDIVEAPFTRVHAGDILSDNSGPAIAVHPDFLPVFQLRIDHRRDLDPLLASVSADADGAVNVLADWLEERGSPLAAQIRGWQAKLAGKRCCLHCGNPYLEAGARVCHGCELPVVDLVQWRLRREVLRLFGEKLAEPEPAMPGRVRCAVNERFDLPRRGPLRVGERAKMVMFRDGRSEPVRHPERLGDLLQPQEGDLRVERLQAGDSMRPDYGPGVVTRVRDDGLVEFLRDHRCGPEPDTFVLPDVYPRFRYFDVSRRAGVRCCCCGDVKLDQYYRLFIHLPRCADGRPTVDIAPNVADWHFGRCPGCGDIHWTRPKVDVQAMTLPGAIP